MSKRFLICLLALLLLTGCTAPAFRSGDVHGDDGNILRGTVKEAHDAYFILEDDSGSLYRIAQDPGKAGGEIAFQGDAVEILHSGIVMETYPMQLQKVYRIILTRE